MTHSEKPYSMMVTSSRKKKVKPTNEVEVELNRDEAERVAQMKKLEARKLQREDKVAKAVGAKYYITNASFPFLLTVGGFTMSVSQYYPDLKLAVDKFYEWNAQEIKEAAIKEKLFEGSGIRYVYLNPSKRLEDVL
jgi:hypothetical protein